MGTMALARQLTIRYGTVRYGTAMYCTGMFFGRGKNLHPVSPLSMFACLACKPGAGKNLTKFYMVSRVSRISRVPLLPGLSDVAFRRDFVNSATLFFVK